MTDSVQLGATSVPISILCVDDQQINRLVAQALLAPFTLKVVCCGGAEEALEILTRQAFDVVLIDVHMSQTSGIGLLRRIHQIEGPNARISAIAVTSDPALGGDFCRRFGFDGFVTRPLSIRMLLSAILDSLAVRRELRSTPADQARRPHLKAGQLRGSMPACESFILPAWH